MTENSAEDHGRGHFFSFGNGMDDMVKEGGRKRRGRKYEERRRWSFRSNSF